MALTLHARNSLTVCASNSTSLHSSVGFVFFPFNTAEACGVDCVGWTSHHSCLPFIFVRYSCSYSITTVDCHPNKLCIATGNSRGEVQLWYVDVSLLLDVYFELPVI